MDKNQVLIGAFLDELEKISEDLTFWDRFSLIAPAVGGLYGAATGKNRRLMSALEGASIGATIGWVPGIIRDLQRAAGQKRG